MPSDASQTTLVQTADVQTANPFSPRVRHLLDTAWRQFRALGFQKVSVDSIARESAVSKETIYRHFDGKEAIFRAALDRARWSLLHSLPNLEGRVSLDPGDIQACLRTIYAATLDPDRPATSWISISVATAFPELAASLHQESMEGLVPIARYLAAHVRPILSGAEALEAASRLGALAFEGPALLMCGDQMFESGCEARAAKVTHLLLWGCPRPSRPLRNSTMPDPVNCEIAAPVPPPDHSAQAGWAPNLRSLLGVAQSQFFAHGYDAANLDEIGELARVGRGTLYRKFGNKAGLFTAAMLDAADAIAGRSSGAVPPSRDDFLTDLEQAAFAVADILLHPGTLQLYRSVIAERNWNQSLAQQVYTISRAPLMAAIVSLLRKYQDEGRILTDDLQWWSMQFMTMATAGNRYLSLQKPPAAASRRLLARQTAVHFAQGICRY